MRLNSEKLTYHIPIFFLLNNRLKKRKKDDYSEEEDISENHLSIGLI